MNVDVYFFSLETSIHEMFCLNLWIDNIIMNEKYCATDVPICDNENITLTEYHKILKYLKNIGEENDLTK